MPEAAAAVSPRPAAGRAYGGESLEARTERRRRQLLDAGLELFGTVGYRASTVRTLCREARMGDRHFYEQFDNTEALLVAVYDECLDRLLTAVVEAVAGAVVEAVAGAVVEVGPGVGADRSLADVAGEGLDAFFAVVQDDPRLARVVWLEVLGVGPRVEATYGAGMRVFGELLMTHARRLTGTAPGHPDVERFLATATAGGVSQAAMAWLLEDYATPRATVVKALTRYVRGVAVGLGD